MVRKNIILSLEEKIASKLPLSKSFDTSKWWWQLEKNLGFVNFL